MLHDPYGPAKLLLIAATPLAADSLTGFHGIAEALGFDVLVWFWGALGALVAMLWRKKQPGTAKGPGDPLTFRDWLWVLGYTAGGAVVAGGLVPGLVSVAIAHAWLGPDSYREAAKLGAFIVGGSAQRLFRLLVTGLPDVIEAQIERWKRGGKTRPSDD